MVYAVYIVQCADGSLYTGIATDVQRRLLEHNGVTGGASARTAGGASARTAGGASARTAGGAGARSAGKANSYGAARGKGARYTAARRPVVLVFEMPFETRSQAAKEEARIKRLRRDQKQLLITAILSGQAVRA